MALRNKTALPNTYDYDKSDQNLAHILKSNRSHIEKSIDFISAELNYLQGFVIQLQANSEAVRNSQDKDKVDELVNNSQKINHLHNEMKELKGIANYLESTDFSTTPSKPSKELTPVEKAITSLLSIVNNLRNGKITISNIATHENEDGTTAYQFQTEPILTQYSFIKAVNLLHNNNNVDAIKRSSWTDDRVILLDNNDNLVQKFKGNDRIFDWQITKDDVEANDWEAINKIPNNPNSNPTSDNRDDSADTNNQGYYNGAGNDPQNPLGIDGSTLND